MLTRTLPPMIDNAFVDYFCGLSGSGEGLRMAGFDLKAGVNHWSYALEMFEKHHPGSSAILTDISKSDPSWFPRTRFKWASCECDTHSNARGVKEVRQQLELFATQKEDPAVWRSRVTAWDAIYLALAHDPDCFVIENVVQFATKWVEYEEWLAAWHRMGYTVVELYLNAQFFGVPQSRDRLYVVAYKRNAFPMRLRWTYPAYCPRCERTVQGVQHWKKHLKSKQRGVYGSKNGQYIIACPNHAQVVEVFPATVPAASIINWSHTAEPILQRKRPLKPKTIERIRRGLQKYGRITQVVDLARNDGSERSRPTDRPTFTQTQAETQALMQPLLIGNYSPGWARPTSDPLGTVTSTDHHALVVRLTHPDESNGRRGGDKAWTAQRPLPVVTSRADLGIVQSEAAFLTKLYGTSHAADLEKPTPTITSSGEHLALVQHGFIAPYNGEPNARSVTMPAPVVTSAERLGLVQHQQTGEPLTNAMIDELLETSTFRMLEPDDELLPAMDLARYRLDGSRRNKTAATGNAVVAEMARQIGLAIRAAYYGPEAAQEWAQRYPERRSQWLEVSE